MTDPVDALLVDLVSWIAREDRDYREVMDTWRTSCPRLPVWEEANDRRLVVRNYEVGRGAIVSVTIAGRAFLDARKDAEHDRETYDKLMPRRYEGDKGL